ncbi:hypothetical protein N431DRAFT_485229, partial [Stipitochalara longipes BDJ]
MSTIAPIEPLPVAATSFPRFSSLPPEIRQLIWQNSASPQIVFLELAMLQKHTCSRVWSETSIDGPEFMGFFDLDHQPEQVRADAGPYPPWAFKTRSVPPLFLVCRESYLVAKEKIYTKSFGTEFRLPSIWFNFEVDILHLDWGYYLHEYEDDPEEFMFKYLPSDFSEDVKKVKNLTLYNG